MEKKPLISVVVPVYQVEQWLQRCVDSLLKQTYQNKEIILVDDGSLDRGGEICDEYAARERSIRVIHQLNQGLSAARNAGTLISNGQYITFVDSDDWVEPDYLEKLWSVIYNTGADVAVCGYSKEPEGTVFGRIDGKTECFSPERAIELLCYQKCVETSAWAKLYRTEDAREFLYPEGRVFEDIATTYKFFANANRVAMYGGRFIIIGSTQAVLWPPDSKKADLMHLAEPMSYMNLSCINTRNWSGRQIVGVSAATAKCCL